MSEPERTYSPDGTLLAIGGVPVLTVPPVVRTCLGNEGRMRWERTHRTTSKFHSSTGESPRFKRAGINVAAVNECDCGAIATVRIPVTQQMSGTLDKHVCWECSDLIYAKQQTGKEKA